ncbi:uncharacterized protein B0I36DRAFT_434646 [Microdochium trichocladiopsis]|uniref:Uncharacterized protein n=1 Tax=Microdochium trichocladiopsis TaxID=1682393 RepID=A0A9P8XYK5_9PEZI|nr:uncharacterized protein B0I36DRAFT_434646 [Microdochium trichocladiopsis]KAH7025171.1 hypothetical protein B0I36DRAFT_434646 [Microdochium trichocladiopsis]
MIDNNHNVDLSLSVAGYDPAGNGSHSSPQIPANAHPLNTSMSTTHPEHSLLSTPSVLDSSGHSQTTNTSRRSSTDTAELTASNLAAASSISDYADSQAQDIGADPHSLDNDRSPTSTISQLSPIHNNGYHPTIGYGHNGSPNQHNDDFQQLSHIYFCTSIPCLDPCCYTCTNSSRLQDYYLTGLGAVFTDYPTYSGFYGDELLAHVEDQEYDDNASPLT